MKENWEVKTLGEICTFNRGLTYKKSDEVNVSKNAVLRANNIDLQSFSLNFDDIRYISEKIEIPTSKKLKKDSVLICTASGSKTHLGKVAFIDKDYDYAFGGFMALLTPNKDLVDSKYFFTILTSAFFREHLDRLSAGANINNLKFSQIEDFEIPLPPISEQKRIVKILDEKFVAIEKLKKVTEEQLVDVKELFLSKLNAFFDNPDSYWISDSLINLTEKIGSGATPRGGKKSYKKEGISLVRSLNVHDCQFKYSDLAFIDGQQAEKLDNVTLQKGDVLFNITGASVARCCVLPEDILPARVNQHVSILRPKSSLLRPMFLMYLMVSRANKDKLLLTGELGGSTRQAITKAQLEEFEIRYPSLQVQKDIENELSDLEDKTKELKLVFAKKLADLEELKKSYLEQAFAGKL